MIKVLIVDDHDMVRTGLRVFLEEMEDMQPIGDVASGEEAMHFCREQPPDVILMDLIMPGMGGIAAIEAIREQNPKIQVVALTSFEDNDLVYGALYAGAIGYILKNTTITELAQTIRMAHQGQASLAPEASQVLVERQQPNLSSLGSDLTPREVEVLRLMVRGSSNNEIGEFLHISPSTVKNHVSSILMKLQAATRTEAVAMALHHRLVDYPS